MDTSRVLHALMSAFEHGIRASAHPPGSEDALYYEERMRLCVRAAAENAGFTVFARVDEGREKAA
jgi:hypothetical protein